MLVKIGGYISNIFWVVPPPRIPVAFLVSYKDSLLICIYIYLLIPLAGSSMLFLTVVTLMSRLDPTFGCLVLDWLCWKDPWAKSWITRWECKHIQFVVLLFFSEVGGGKDDDPEILNHWNTGLCAFRLSDRLVLRFFTSKGLVSDNIDRRALKTWDIQQRSPAHSQ